MNHETLVQRFWTHVANKADRPAVLIKNQLPSIPYVVPIASAHYPYFPPADPPALRALTWNDVGHFVAEIMVYLQEKGFQKGDHVAILSWNCPEWVWTDLAVQTLGGVTVPIYPNTSAAGTCFLLNDCGAKFLFTDDLEQLAKADDRLLEVGLTGRALFADALKSVSDYSTAPKPLPFSTLPGKWWRLCVSGLSAVMLPTTTPSMSLTSTQLILPQSFTRPGLQAGRKAPGSPMATLRLQLRLLCATDSISMSLTPI